MKNLFPSGFITLSFDDGWRSVYENALPILEEAKLKSSHYIISGCLDSEQFPRYMDIKQVKDLARLGHEIGCHTVFHRHLITEIESIIREEIILSKKYLDKIVGSVETFSYPYGEYNDLILKTVKKAGFLGARSTIDGFDDEKSDLFLLKCKAVAVKTSISDVKNWIDYARNHNVWLILMFHQIDNEGREWSSTPETLKDITDYIIQTNINIITVSEGVKKLKG